jgi:hypothetical protein
MAMVLRFAALLPADRMGIIEPNQSLAVRPMQRQGIIDAMRPLRRYGDPRHDETNPVTAVFIHDEHLPIEVKKRVEGRVRSLH